jgi:secondary thiamine-phosphate synthase enzyme
LKTISLKTRQPVEFIDITEQVAQAVTESKVRDGLCTVFVPHTTAGLTINENADPDVREDIIAVLNKLIPAAGAYRHLEGNSHAHIKSSLLGHSHTVIVQGGEMQLGTWQGIYFCEFDGPRSREVWVRITRSGQHDA